ncbi:MAG: zinc-dependent metalloprotease family protein [Silicimonas sp.]|jgi:hypothetical protein|uniref:zinc-dependent metalloprotease family protein n=1 Tax=Roseitalea porphyridii TaxID=1852022 RepID=UPI0032EFD1A2
MTNLRLRSLVGLLFLAVSTAPASSQSLIDAFVAAELTPELQEALDRILEEPAVAEARIVEVDTEVLGSPQVFFDLGAVDGPAYMATASEETSALASERLASGEAFSWVSELTGEVTVETVLEVDSSGQLYGAIYGEEANFEIRPVTGGAHALIEYDPFGFPPEHPAELPIAPDAEYEDGGIAPDLPDNLEPVRVLVAFTRSAAGLYPNPESQARLIIASANRVYERTNIPTRLELASAVTTDYGEGISMYDDLELLRGRSDGSMDELHARRDSAGADLVHLIAVRSDYCGLAYVNASAAYAFGITTAHCAIGNLSFVHEIGHNFGACHDPMNSGSCKPYASDAYGYQHPDGDFRTVMAYRCPIGACPRHPMLSHPTKYGEAGRHNVRRATHARTPAVSGFR